jgi:hypothetical protein
MKIAAQVINPLVHRLLIEPTHAKDAHYEGRQSDDYRNDQGDSFLSLYMGQLPHDTKATTPKAILPPRPRHLKYR